MVDFTLFACLIIKSISMTFGDYLYEFIENGSRPAFKLFNAVTLAFDN